MLIDRLVRELESLGATARLELAAGSVDRTPDALLRIELDGATAVFGVELKPRSPYPSEVSGLDQLREQLAVLGQPLLFAPYISAGQGAALTSHGWSWADDHGNFDLRSGPIRLRQRVAQTGARKPKDRIPRGGGGLAVVRLLIRRPSDLGTDRLRQTRLAKAAGVSQARVAQVMAQLREAGLVTSGDGSSDEDRARLLDAFLAAYPGPGGRERYFYSLDPLRAVAKRLASRHPVWTAAVSADVGPDLVAPFRAPTILVAYAEGPADLDLS